jgi:mRNA-degrading endonuclease toxin of MazEF toxin-antitoxin module
MRVTLPNSRRTERPRLPEESSTPAAAEPAHHEASHPRRRGGVSYKNGLILLDQMRTLDKQRLVRHLGAVERRTLLATLTRLRDVFAD